MSGWNSHPSDYTVKQPEEWPLCVCFMVKETAIAEAIESHNIQDIRELRQRTQAGCGCGSCVGDLVTMLERHKAGLPPICPRPAIAARPGAMPPKEIPLPDFNEKSA